MSGFGYRNLGFGGGNYAAPAYDIPNSMRFEDGDSSNLSRTQGSGNRRTWTYSVWFKRGNLSQKFLAAWQNTAENSDYDGLDLSLDTIRWYPSGSSGGYLTTTQVFRDSSAWYHLVLAVDTTQGTASNRAMMYINGERITDFANETYPVQNYDGQANISGRVATIGSNVMGSSSFGGFYDGYMAEIHFIDGTALTPSTFGEAGDYGEWKAKAVSGVTYGTNGFYLDFKLSATGTSGIGKDQSGNGNDFASSGYAATDQMLDSPTNNFPTFNPLDNARTDSGTVILKEGNLFQESVSADASVFGSISFSSGKWYAEFLVVNAGNTRTIGIIPANDVGGYIGHPLVGAADAYGYRGVDGTLYTGQTETATSVGTTTTGDIISVSVDLDSGTKTIKWQKNGADLSGTTQLTITQSGSDWIFGIRCDATQDMMVNFGQDSSFAGNKTGQNNADDNGYGDFYYAPPTGFLALCTKNMAVPTVVPSEHFNTVLYDGTQDIRSVTGVGFQPDLAWIKHRQDARSGALLDAVRGATKILTPDTNAAEYTEADSLTSFDTDGFTLGDDNNTYRVNEGGGTPQIVAWNWKAGNATLGTGDFTQGSIPSTCSRNAAAGFSIVSYSGDASATADGSNNSGAYWNIGHGLSTAPEVIMVKKRQAAAWYMGHISLGSDVWTAGRHLVLNTTAAAAPQTNILWGTGTVNSTLFSAGGWDVINRSGNTYIAYCFHSVDGYSKMGSYVGNGSTDGTFVYTGFRPAWIMVKASSAVGAWFMFDNKRLGYNSESRRLIADTTDTEADPGDFDILSNGFKLGFTSGNANGSGVTYIFLAFAETPFKYANAR
jgi:hypothetical protein